MYRDIPLILRLLRGCSAMQISASIMFYTLCAMSSSLSLIRFSAHGNPDQLPGHVAGATFGINNNSTEGVVYLARMHPGPVVRHQDRYYFPLTSASRRGWWHSGFLARIGIKSTTATIATSSWQGAHTCLTSTSLTAEGQQIQPMLCFNICLSAMIG